MSKKGCHSLPVSLQRQLGVMSLVLVTTTASPRRVVIPSSISPETTWCYGSNISNNNSKSKKGWRRHVCIPGCSATFLKSSWGLKSPHSPSGSTLSGRISVTRMSWNTSGIWYPQWKCEVKVSKVYFQVYDFWQGGAGLILKLIQEAQSEQRQTPCCRVMMSVTKQKRLLCTAATIKHLSAASTINPAALHTTTNQKMHQQTKKKYHGTTDETPL